MTLTEEEIFTAAVALPLSERAAYLDGACAGSAALRSQVDALLAAHDQPDSLLASPAFDVTVATVADADGPGAQIGPYKLLEQIGEGGMGIVYLAQQTHPVKRRVALKLIKPGMDSRQVIARFEAERQALAMMDHPNIARILDAGVVGEGIGNRGSGSGKTEGHRGDAHPTPIPDSRSLNPAARPYFVMELVRGLPITDYCDREKLDIRRRLELFADVCRAVQHAHLKGIIHRDIKPSNVLVTLHDGVPVVKVIDFGVAKALNQELTERTLFTQFSQMIGTPLYMSPEQAELSGLDIDTRTDVYSLGVLLYELLTGSTPFDRAAFSKAGFDEMRRMIREDEPPRPSARITTLQAGAQSTVGMSRSSDLRKLSRHLRGELDWVAMRALEKDRNRRYESASALATDVERYLSDQAVQACPPSAVYRMRKWSRRYRGMLATALAIVVALATGTAVATWQAIRAESSAELAAAATKVAQARLVEVERQRNLADQRLVEVEREREQSQKNFESALEGVERLLAQVDGGGRPGAPLLPEAIRRGILQEASSLYEQLVVESRNAPDVRMHWASFLSRAAYIRGQIGDREAAIEAHAAAIRVMSDVVEKYPQSIDYGVALASACHQSAWFHYHTLRYFTESANLYRRAGEIYERLAKHDKRFVSRLSVELTSLARVLANSGERDEALRLNARALELGEQAAGLSDFTVGVMSYWGRVNAPNYALCCALKHKAALLSQESPEEAAAIYRRVIVISRQTAVATEPIVLQELHVSVLSDAVAFFAQRDACEAERFNRELITILKRIAADFRFKTYFQTSYFAALERQSELLRRLADDESHVASASDEALWTGGPSERTGAAGNLDGSHSAPSLQSGSQTASARLAEAESLRNEVISVKQRLATDNAHDPNRHALVDFVASQARSLRREASGQAQANPRAAEQLADADRLFNQAITAGRERAAASNDPSPKEQLVGLLREQALYLRQQAASQSAKAAPATATSQLADADALFNEAISISRGLAGDRPSKATLETLANTLADQARDLRTKAKAQPGNPIPEAAVWLAEAEKLYNEAISVRTKLVAEFSPDVFQPDKRFRLIEELVKVLMAQAEHLRSDLGDQGIGAPTKDSTARIQEAERIERDAIGFLEELRTNAPQRLQALGSLAQLHMAASRRLTREGRKDESRDAIKEIEEVLVDLEQMVLLDPSNVAAKHKLFWLLKNGVPRELRDNNRALVLAQDMVDMHPAEAHSWQNLAVAQFTLKRYDQALINSQKTLSLDPGNVEALRQIASIHRMRGNYEEALSTAQSAIAANPLRYEGWDARSEIHSNVGNYAQAISDSTQAIELNPGASHLHRRRALAFFKLDRYRAALEDIAQAVQKSPDDMSHLTCIPLRLIAACPDAAFRAGYLQLVDEVVRINNRSSDSLVARANTLAEFGQLDRALEDYSHAIGVAPNDLELYIVRGDLSAQMKQYALAIRDYTHYLDAKAARHVFKRRGMAHFHVGQYENALADLTTAVEAGDTNTLVWDSLPHAVAACPDAAFRAGYVALADRMVELNQKSSDALITRAAILAEFGRHDRARADLTAGLAAGGASNYPQYQSAALALVFDNQSLYRSICGGMLTTFADTQKADAAHYSAWSCVLVPGAVEDYAPAIALARRAAELEPNHKQYLVGWGATLYRAGQFEAALVQLRAANEVEANPLTSPAYVSYLLAMTHHRLGHADEAQQWLDRANQASTAELNDGGSPPQWNRRLTLELFQREATQLIHPPEESSQALP